jgi:hypothetical protein
MYKALISGTILGGFIALILARSRGQRRKDVGRGNNMTAEERIIAHAQALSAERPETATPNQDFIRDWAYGNAGLEDESITVEQVERVLSGRSA